MKEFVMVALLAIFSEMVVPRVTELASAAPKPEAEEAEGAEDESEAAEPEEGEAEAEEGEVERLRTENRLLKELVGEKELAMRLAD